MAKRVWSGIGVGYGWQYSTGIGAYPEPQTSDDLNNIWNAGIRRLRIFVPNFDSAATVLNAVNVLIVKAINRGFYVRAGRCTGRGNLALTSTIWSNFKTDMTNTFAPWAQSVGVQELILGNEEEGHADGSTLTAATVRSDVRALAGTVKTNGFTGLTCYDSETNHSNVANWRADGNDATIFANLDKLSFNCYNRLDSFRITLQSIATQFPHNRLNISEFGSAELGAQGYNDFLNEYNYYEQLIKRIDAIKEAGIPSCQFFTYRDGGTVLGSINNYAVALTSGAYRQALFALTNNVQ